MLSAGRGRQRPLAEGLRIGAHAPWLVWFPLESVFWEGPFPEVGGYGQEGWLGRARALEMPSYLVFLVSKDSVRAETLLALPSVFKGSEVQSRQISLFRPQESLFSVTLMKDLTFCQP